MKILIFGGSGFLGGYLKNFFIIKKIRAITCGRDLSNNFLLKTYNEYEIMKAIKFFDPNVVINLVGLTNVDECEKNLKKAKIVNTDVAKNISSAITRYKKKIFFLHLSTDQVYNFKNSREDKTNPINNYAKTKIKAEKYVIKARGCVVRTNFFGFSKNKKSFLDWIYTSLKKKEEINLFSNIFFSPLYIKNLCKYILLIIKKKKKGLYNVGSRKCVSKAEFGIYFANKMKLNTNFINVIKYDYSKTFAKRPKYMCMNVSKFEKLFNVKMNCCFKEINAAIRDKKNSLNFIS